MNTIFMHGTDRFKLYAKQVGIDKKTRSERVSNSQDKAADHFKSNTQIFKSTNDFMRAGDKIQYDFNDTRHQWVAKGRASDYEVFSGKNIGFDKTSPRFNFDQVFYGQSLKFGVPGPGHYPSNR